MVATLLATFVTALLLPHAPRVVVSRPRVAHIALCAPEDATLKAAAARVIAAAEQFGSAQAEAAAEWIDEAIGAGTDAEDGSKLLQKQLVLFEECLVEDEGGSCEELDKALSALEEELVARSNKGEEVVPPSASWLAAARVRTAAAKYGPEQKRVAELWLAEVRSKGVANPAGLLEAQTELFGECLVDYDDGPSRCEELEQALEALQVSLGIGGKVVSTRGLMGGKVTKKP